MDVTTEIHTTTAWEFANLRTQQVIKFLPTDTINTDNNALQVFEFREWYFHYELNEL